MKEGKFFQNTLILLPKQPAVSNLLNSVMLFDLEGEGHLYVNDMFSLVYLKVMIHVKVVRQETASNMEILHHFYIHFKEKGQIAELDTGFKTD